MTAIASTLLDLLPNATEPWSEVSDEWKQRIEPALASDITPQYLIQPETEAELAIAVSFAHKQALPLLICGRGSKLSWGNLARGADLVVSTAKLNRLIENAAGDLTFTAEAGMTLAEAQAILKPHNLFLAIDPVYPQTATLGGIVATADTGSLRHRYGGVRDMLLGIQFVRADGQVAKAGGRVVKNVAGYDLMKLFTGSYGTLGILTQVTLRAYPIPEVFQSVVLEGDWTQLEQATQAIARSSLSPITLDWQLNASIPSLSLCFANVEESVAEQVQEIQVLGDRLNLGVKILSPATDSEPVFSSAIARDHLDKPLLAKFGLRPTDVASLLQGVQQRMPNAIAVVHASSGLGKLYGDVSLDNCLETLRSQCISCNGFLSFLEVPRMLKDQVDIWGYSGNALSLMRQIKRQFNPKENLNIGRFVTD